MDHNQQSDSMSDVINTLSQYSGEQKRKLIQAPDGQEFWVHNGPALRNLHDLRDIMNTISHDQFNYHVAPGKNDFANWVRDILQDQGCARELMRCKTPLSTKRTIIKFLRQYA